MSQLTLFGTGLLFGLARHNLYVANLLMSTRWRRPAIGLVSGQHLPDEHHQLASHCADGFVMGLLFAQAQIESLERAGGAHGGVSGFYQQPAGVRASALGDASGAKAVAGALPSQWIQAQVADQPARLAEAASITDGGQPPGSYLQAETGDGWHRSED